MFKEKIVLIKKISDILFGIIILFSIGVMVKNYIDQYNLPEGVCPISNNSVYMVTAIILLIVAFISTTIIDYIFKKYKKDKGEAREQ